MTGTVCAGTTYYVDADTGNDANNGQAPGSAWETITHAVNTVPAGASPADPNSIQVAAGLYDTTNNGETFDITFDNANIKLVGAGAATTTIDGEGAGMILDINATGITVEGFNITNATHGIGSDDVGGFSVLNNIFYNLGDGVHFDIYEDDLASDYSVEDILISGNTINSSSDGVYIEIELYYNESITGSGFTVTIGDIDILDNVFMRSSDCLDIDDLDVRHLDGGSISIGDINILRNEFYGGGDGIDSDCYSTYLTNTTITVGDVVISDNTFENQTSDAIEFDYYEAEYWNGTTTGTFGDLVITGNVITSTGHSCDGIDLEYGDFSYFEDDASLMAGNLEITDNVIEVDDDGIDLDYEYIYKLYNNSAITAGEISITGNTIDSDEYGICLYYYGIGEYMYGNSEITTGDVHIEGNTIDSDDEAIYVYYEYVAYEMKDDTILLMGDTYVVDNEISADDDGIYIEYYDYEVGEYNDNYAYAELPSYIITGNTFDVTGDGIEIYTYSNPDDTYGDSVVDYGGFLIDDNTFSCANGIYFYIEDVCEDCYDSSGAIIRDITITNNRFNDVDETAIYIYFDDVGYCFDDDGMVEVGDMVIADNVIDGAGGYGVYVEYYNIYSEYSATVTMGVLDILRNDISNVADDGIYVIYDIDVDGDSTTSIGRALIQDNTIDGCGANGIYMSMSKDVDTSATLNFGDPIIEGNTIQNCEDGIYFDHVEYATIKRNMIMNNVAGPTGVHLDGDSDSNEIHENCFYDNIEQAWDDGTGNDWTGNYWSPSPGGIGDYTIPGRAGSEDSKPLDECQPTECPECPPVRVGPDTTANVPVLTPSGLVLLIGLLAVVGSVMLRRRE
jgi:parallel beta-helix repeat protein